MRSDILPQVFLPEYVIFSGDSFLRFFIPFALLTSFHLLSLYSLILEILNLLNPLVGQNICAIIRM